jgi:hypothetical protein
MEDASYEEAVLQFDLAFQSSLVIDNIHQAHHAKAEALLALNRPVTPHIPRSLLLVPSAARASSCGARAHHAAGDALSVHTSIFGRCEPVPSPP